MSEAKPRTFKFMYEERGFYQVFYKRNETGALYCIQNDGSWGKDNFVFYLCTPDGEAEAPAVMPPETAFDRLVYPDSLARS